MFASLGRESDVDVTLCGRFCDETLRNRSEIVRCDPIASMARKRVAALAFACYSRALEP